MSAGQKAVAELMALAERPIGRAKLHLRQLNDGADNDGPILLGPELPLDEPEDD